MKYALLGYDHGDALGRLPAEEQRALHHGHASLHDTEEVKVISHYRVRGGPLRALYFVESDDRDAVAAFCARLPAARAGATFEIWPLSEPTGASTPS